jgi:hypothetical protein
MFRANLWKSIIPQMQVMLLFLTIFYFFAIRNHPEGLIALPSFLSSKYKDSPTIDPVSPDLPIICPFRINFPGAVMILSK